MSRREVILRMLPALTLSSTHNEPSQMAAECSPGRKPGVRCSYSFEPHRGGRITFICRPLRGLDSFLGLRPRAYARGYTLQSLRGLIECRRLTNCALSCSPDSRTRKQTRIPVTLVARVLDVTRGAVGFICGDHLMPRPRIIRAVVTFCAGGPGCCGIERIE
jgi:hypothetical protein